MEKEYRSVLKYLFLTGKSSQDIIEEMKKVHGDLCPSQATLYLHLLQFRRGIFTLEDDPKAGRPPSVCVEANVERIKKLIGEEPRLSTREIEERLKIGHVSIHRVLTEHLGMKRMNCRWIPKELTAQQKLARVASCKLNVRLFRRSFEEFRGNSITCDETSVKFYTPESRTSGSEWRVKGSKPPTRSRMQDDKRTVMMTVFWDDEGILLTDALEKGQTITAEYYSQLLSQLPEVFRRKRKRKEFGKMHLLHDNVRPHTAKRTHEKLQELELPLIKHPPYSPDLAPSDYFLFKNLKIFLQGKRYATRNEFEGAVLAFFEEKPPEFYESGLDKLLGRWKSCIDLGGDYLDQ